MNFLHIVFQRQYNKKMSSWYRPPVFEPIKYVPSSDKDQIRAKPVFALHAIAHEHIPGPHDGGLTNHWCSYLQISETEDESVCINAQPNPQQEATTIPGGSKADVIVSVVHGPVVNATHTAKIPVAEGVTVGQLVDCLAQHGREKYDFTADGVGCRKWTTDTLTLLAQQGWLVSNEAVEAATGDIKKLWPEGTSLALDNGMYHVD
jgi:hypothetical protein